MANGPLLFSGRLAPMASVLAPVELPRAKHEAHVVLGVAPSKSPNRQLTGHYSVMSLMTPGTSRSCWRRRPVSSIPAGFRVGWYCLSCERWVDSQSSSHAMTGLSVPRPTPREQAGHRSSAVNAGATISTLRSTRVRTPLRRTRSSSRPRPRSATSGVRSQRACPVARRTRSRYGARRSSAEATGSTLPRPHPGL